MKLMKRIAVGIASLLVLTSCSVLQKAASASSLGGNTGTAIAAIYNVLKAAGGIDLSNLTNIINLGKILTGAGALSNATQAFADEFSTALINGSNNLVNSGNVAKVWAEGAQQYRHVRLQRVCDQGLCERHATAPAERRECQCDGESPDQPAGGAVNRRA